MSLKSDEVKTDTLDTISSTSMNIGLSASTISIGSLSKVNVGNLSNYKTIKSSTLNISTQTNTLTITDLLNYQIIVSGFSSTNPATVNDIITFNMPTPTADIEGIVYTFRKVRGAFSAGSTNLTFNWTTNSYIVNNTGLTTTGQPTNIFSTSATLIRMVVVGYLGTYYFILA